MPSNHSNSYPVSCFCQSQKLLVSAFTDISARAGTGTEQDDTGDRPVAPAEPLALTLPLHRPQSGVWGSCHAPGVESSSVCPQGAVLGDSLAQGN